MSKGLYHKFRVERTDGTDKPGGKHEDCSYFVLDIKHDVHAIAALAAYADACKESYPQLAVDLEAVIIASEDIERHPSILSPSEVASRLRQVRSHDESPNNKLLEPLSPRATPWEVLHRLWSKAVGTKSYVKTEWQRLERVVPGPAQERDDG